MQYYPIEDGITHINIYSKGKTGLGRILTNFAHTPVKTLDGYFESIEGYWSWLGISENNSEREKFRELFGLEAKNFRRKLIKAGDPGRFDNDFQHKIAYAIHNKFLSPEVEEELLKHVNLLDLPIAHYYYFGNNPDNYKIVDETDKFPEFLESVRRELDLWKQKEILKATHPYRLVITESAGQVDVILESLQFIEEHKGDKVWISPDTYFYDIKENLLKRCHENKLSSFDNIVKQAEEIFKSKEYHDRDELRKEMLHAPSYIPEKEEAYIPNKLASETLSAQDKEITDILSVKEGIICHQVNCQNAMGAGVAKAIYEKYPIVKEKYHSLFNNHTKEQLFGQAQLVHVADGLDIINLFTQLKYGNGAKDGKVYTDEDKLIEMIGKICRKFPDRTVYIPARIGCGLAGGNWEKVSKGLADLNVSNLYIVDNSKAKAFERKEIEK